MRGRSALMIAGLAITGSVLASTPATAKPIDKGHFHDVFTSDVYDCDGTQAQDSGHVSGNFVFNQRGSSAFPYYRESVHGSVATTNLDTGGTYTNVFTANGRDHKIVNNGDGTPAQDSGDVSGNFVFNQRGSSPFPYYRESVHGTVVTTNLATGGTYTNVFTSNSRDHTIVDNGDGTITITTFASGGSRFYDTSGKLVLRDPGQFRFAVDFDFNGTPGDPSDDVEVPGSFRVVRSSTGNSDLSDRDVCADLVEFTS